MSARPEDDTSKQMRRALYEIGALWQRVRKKVDRAGDTVTGDLDAQDSMFRPKRTVSGTDYRAEFYVGTNGDLVILLRANGSLVGQQFRQRASQGDTEVQGDMVVTGSFDVSGSKNAQVNPEDPDNPNRRYRFSATESDRPGVLEHEVELDTGTTYSLPAHWPRIATNLRCYLQPLGEGHVWPEVDAANWTVTPRGQPGTVLALIRADRADVGVANWIHEVEVSEDREAA